ncbi:UbiA prenyltransferase family protein [Lutibacter flavus]|uniref:UbiA prenyltransferase family protein n=1 Tax=Lutibacter flavus TaxID=691689 RepID=A0A238XT76_9FLAO|nr:hypothetical protein [Lutibacter flavus]SNR62175.1 hypothetical protein SAMN04488111_2106 [Lutibacter flavus]
MPFLKRIFDFYVFSNIHVALAGFCITKLSLLKFGINSNLVPSFVGLSIIASYNFIRFYEIKKKRLSWFKSWFYRNKLLILSLSIISISVVIYITFFTDFNRNSLIILFPFALMTVFYVVPLFKLKGIEFSFRYFPAIKIFSIAIAWAGISVFFPLYEAEVTINSIVYFEFIQRVLILIAITIPFDIRDVNSDFKSLKTIPQLIGIEKSKIVGTVLLGLFLGFSLLNNDYLISDLRIALITGFFLWFTSDKKSKYYTSFWVESIPIIWLIITILL